MNRIIDLEFIRLVVTIVNKHTQDKTINFNKRYNNHLSVQKNSNPGRSNSTKHLLENKHSIISNVKEDIKILKYSENGRNMPSWEGSLYIHKNEFQNNILSKYMYIENFNNKIDQI